MDGDLCLTEPECGTLFVVFGIVVASSAISVSTSMAVAATSSGVSTQVEVSVVAAVLYIST